MFGEFGELCENRVLSFCEVNPTPNPDFLMSRFIHVTVSVVLAACMFG